MGRFSLSRKFLVYNAVLAAGLAFALLLAWRMAERGAHASAEAALDSAARVAERSFEHQGRVLDAGVQVFLSHPSHQRLLREGDPLAVRDSFQRALGELDVHVAVAVHPGGEVLSCTTDGSKADYGDVEAVLRALDPGQARTRHRRGDRALPGHHVGVKGGTQSERQRAGGPPFHDGDPGPAHRGFLVYRQGHFQITVRTMFREEGRVHCAVLHGRRLDRAMALDLRRLSFPQGPGGSPTELAFLGSGRLLGSTLEEAEAQALEQVGDLAQFHQNLRTDRASRSRRLRLGEAAFLATAIPIPGLDGPRHGMGCLILMPLAPFEAPFRPVKLALLAAGALPLLLGILLYLRATRRVTGPLQALARALCSVAEGRRADLPPFRSADEVGELHGGFQALLAELRAKEELLQALEKVRSGGRMGASGSLPSHLSLPGAESKDVETTRQVPPELLAKRIRLEPGQVFAGRYRVERVLGQGGMGLVVKVRDMELDEDAALKVIRPELEMGPEFLEALKQEIRLARRITHRHVLRTHDFGEWEGVPFVTMEYLPGVALNQLLQDRGRLPLPMALRIARQVAEGLAAAHAEGVVHRDVKPHNVLFDARGEAKLMDFGLAAPVEAPGPNEAGMVFGTPRYMAPEQVRGEPAEPRTDLYAFGVLLFEVLLGHAPYEEAGITALLRQHLETPVPDLAVLAPELPADLRRLLTQLLAKAPKERPQSAVEVAERLRILLQEIEGTRRL